jgi:hypothetical protein
MTGARKIALRVSTSIKHSQSIVVKAMSLYLLGLKIKDTTENYKTLSRSSPMFFLFPNIPPLAKLKRVRQSL